jgi:stage II sporulation protein D
MMGSEIRELGRRLPPPVRRPARWPFLLTLAVIAAPGLSCRPRTVQQIERPAGPLVPVDLNIRVRLAHAVDQIELAVTGPYRICQANGQVLVESDNPLSPSPIRLGAAGNPTLCIGQNRLSDGPVDVVPAEDGTIRLGEHRYRGYLRIVPCPEGVTAVNVVHVESYLKGVLRGELPRWFSRATFRAQAIAARTYALYQKLTAGEGREYDVLATEASQVYLGAELECSKAVEAVDYTRGIVLTWSSPLGERIFASYYSSTCGGMTQSVANCKAEPEIPPLAGGVVCQDCRNAPYYYWPSVRLSKQFIADQLRARYSRMAALGPVERIDVLTQTQDGRVIRLKVADSAGNAVELRGEDFRLAVGPYQLKSTRFTVAAEPDAFVFSNGRGFGHGMGMCQYGAEGMARRGATAAQILSYYYPQSHLTKAYE